VRALSSVTPGAVRTAAKSRMRRMSGRGHATDLVISAELRAQLADLLRPDVAQLVRWMPANFTGWGLL
jgi:hypothetical protein